MITTYEEMTLGKYLDLLAVVNEEGLDELTRQVKIIAILSDRSEDELLHIPIGEYTALSSKLGFLMDAPKECPSVKDEYEVGGMVLVPVKDYRKLETGQYIDFKAYAPQVDEYFPQFLSVLLVPKGHRYNEGYDMDEVQKAVKEMTLPDALAVVSFFLLSWKGLTEDFLNYSEQAAKALPKEDRKKVKKAIAEIREDIRQSGDGLQV
jgi:hypothetical protein